MSGHRAASCGRPVLLAGLLLAAACAEGAGRGEVRPGVARGAVLEQDGVRVALTIEPIGLGEAARGGRPTLRDGDTARVTFHVTDKVAGTGLAGLHLGAWLVPRPVEAQGAAPDAKATRDVIRQLVASSIGVGAVTNLNTYFIVTLNDDATLTLLDPMLDFSRTRMKSMIQLPGPGTDMAFGPRNDLLFVTLCERGEVAVIETATMTLRETLPLGGAPSQLWTQPARGLVWVGDDAGERVFALDGTTGRQLATIDAGRGEKMFAGDAEGRFVFVASRGDSRVQRVALPTMAVTEVQRLDGTVQGLAFSDAAGAVYACDSGGRIQVAPVNGDDRDAGPGVPAGSGPIWAAPGGRWIFVAEPGAHRVHVIDAATGQPSRTIETGAIPDRMVFSDGFAYVHAAGSRELTLIQLSALAGSGAAPTLRIPIGQQDPKRPAEGPGDLIAATPDRTAALVAVPDERLIYLYAEGMNAPMGSYQNHGRRPVALAVLDRSLQETAPGVYTTLAPIEHAGLVDVYLYLDQPTQICGRFELKIEEDPQEVHRRMLRGAHALPEPVSPTTMVQVGETAEFLFRVFDRASREPVVGVADLSALVHARFGNWQRRGIAAEPLPDGRYRLQLSLPRAGLHQIRLQSPSLNLLYNNHRAMEVTAVDDVIAPVPARAADAGQGDARR